MSENPYESPNVSGKPPARKIEIGAVVSYLVTSVVIGSLAGAAAMFCYAVFWVAPIWGPQMYKGDVRWETVFFIASTLLPISVVVGIVMALLGACFTSFRLKHRGILISCVVLWFLISVNRPIVSRVRRPEFPDPSFETVPDTMLLIVWILFALTCLSALIKWFANSATKTASQ